MRTPTKTIYPELVDANITNSIDFLQKFTTYLKSIGMSSVGSSEDLTDEAATSINYRNSTKTGDPVTTISNFFNEIDKKELKNFNLDYVYYWVKKYNVLPNVIKNKIKKEKNSYYQEISDSVGTLANMLNKMSDNTGPVWDFNLGKFGIPIPHSIEMTNKISNNTLELSYELQKKNTSLMRNNLKNLISQTTKLDKQLQQVAADPTQSHSNNLVTDIKFYEDFFSNLQSLIDNLKNNFSKDYYEFICYFNTINDKIGYNPRSSQNLQIMANLFFEIDIEGNMQKVDLLQKKLVNSRSFRTIRKALSIERKNSPSPQNTNTINERFLGGTNEFKLPVPVSLQNASFFNNNSSIMQVPNNALGKINEIFDKIGPDNIPGFSAAFNNSQVSSALNTFGLGSLDPTGGINKITNFVLSPLKDSISGFASLATNPFSILSDSIKISGTSGIPNILPGANLGSFPEIASLVTSTNLKNLDPMSVLALAENIKNIICNFKLPIIGKIDMSDFINIEFDPKKLLAKLKSMIPKFPKKDEFIKFMKDLVPDFKSIFKNIYKKLFEC